MVFYIYTSHSLTYSMSCLYHICHISISFSPSAMFNTFVHTSPLHLRDYFFLSSPFPSLAYPTVPLRLFHPDFLPPFHALLPHTAITPPTSPHPNFPPCHPLCPSLRSLWHDLSLTSIPYLPHLHLHRLILTLPHITVIHLPSTIIKNDG